MAAVESWNRTLATAVGGHVTSRIETLGQVEVELDRGTLPRDGRLAFFDLDVGSWGRRSARHLIHCVSPALALERVDQAPGGQASQTPFLAIEFSGRVERLIRLRCF